MHIIIWVNSVKEKPKVYHEIIKEFHNNMEVYMEDIDDNTDIRAKIMDITRRKDFLYFKEVRLKIGNDYYDKKIAGIVNNNVVTIDREYIPISKIRDIEIK